MCMTTFGTLTLASLLSDPLTRAVMKSDGVSEHEFATLLRRVQNTLAGRERPCLQPLEQRAGA